MKIEGRVVHKRNLSKNVVFTDVLSDNQERFCIVFKGLKLVANVKRGDGKINLGDRISVATEDVEESNAYKAIDYTVLEKWAENHPNESFTPIPPRPSKVDMGNNICTAPRVGHCKFWINTGHCPHGSNCSFQHIKDKTLIKAERAVHVSAKLDRRLALQEGNHDSYVSRHQRARIFAEWLTKIFDVDLMRKGHVLDVAGGRGDLAFELALNHDVECIVIDPRDATTDKIRLKKYQRSKLKKAGKAEESLFINMREEFNDQFCTTNREILRKTTLVVGLHPDQATEPLVDVCLSQNLPFAVIPCCVFAHENPNRRLASGENPTTYESFCDFLMEKSRKISYDHLGFRGRNKVLYSRIESDLNKEMK